MNLHQVPTDTAPPDEDEDEDETDGIHCPTCDISQWQRRQFGTYSETHWIDLGNNHEDWDDHEDWAEGSDPWECINHHTAPDEIAEILDDF